MSSITDLLALQAEIAVGFTEFAGYDLAAAHIFPGSRSTEINP